MRDTVKEPPQGCAAPILTVRGLGFVAEGQTLLRGIDLEIARGRRTLIMGANGAGKSLLLRLLHGLLPPCSGAVLWHGERPARRAQAMVFQRPVMLRRSVIANLRFALRVQGLGWRAREARAVTKRQISSSAVRDRGKRMAYFFAVFEGLLELRE